MDITMTSEQQMLKDGVERFTRGFSGFEQWRKQVGNDAAFDADNWRRMAEMGWLALGISGQDGGIGATAAETMLVMDGIGRGLMREPYVSTCVLAMHLISKGGHTLRSSLLEGIADGSVLIATALGEPQARFHLNHVATQAQSVEGGFVLSAAEAVAGLSVTARVGLAAPGPLTVSVNGLENAFLKATLAADGTLSSVIDKRTGRECLAGRGNQIWAYVDKPRFFDAWDIEEDYAGSGQEVLAEAIEVTESGPHRAALKITRHFGASTIVQHVRLWSNSPRLEFHTELDWHDRRVLLKTRFPLAVKAEQALFECACGVIARPTHRNTAYDEAKFEGAAHRFALLAERGFGVALLNDGKYGHHALGNELGISLLRSPVFPDLLADEGRQTFTYALLPFAGDWLDGGVLAEAQDLNQPLFAKAAQVTEGVWQAVAVEGALALSALKPSEAGDGLILRLYEPAGGSVRPEIRIASGWQESGVVNLLEEPAEASDTLGPFAITSVKMTRG